MGHRVLVCLSMVLAVLLLTGCPQKSPEMKIAETRNEYFLEPTGMLIQEIEPEMEIHEGGPEAAVEAASAEMSASEAAEGDEEGTMEEEGPRTVNVLFDLIIRFDGLRDSLPGITIEVAHSDPFDKEKAHYRQWIDTEGMSKGDARQLSFELEIPDYESGDVFTIEFRDYIPPEEFGDYREFSATAP